MFINKAVKTLEADYYIRLKEKFAFNGNEFWRHVNLPQKYVVNTESWKV